MCSVLLNENFFTCDKFWRKCLMNTKQNLTFQKFGNFVNLFNFKVVPFFQVHNLFNLAIPWAVMNIHSPITIFFKPSTRALPGVPLSWVIIPVPAFTWAVSEPATVLIKRNKKCLNRYTWWFLVPIPNLIYVSPLTKLPEVLNLNVNRSSLRIGMSAKKK